MSSWNLLDEKEEADLHKSRLLNVEEKPFKRVTKRLMGLQALVSEKVRQAPTPPPEGTGANGTGTTDPASQGNSGGGGTQPSTPTAKADQATALPGMKEDIVLDFAAFDGSIARLQFLLAANERECSRYAADRVRILETSQEVRNSTAQLRQRLDEARATLEQRKKFDDLADRITSNRMLRPRGDQTANLRKLEEECAELEAESETYAATWRERKEQFSRIMDESMRLRRLIRDEKEEVERREGMDDEGAEGAHADADADSVQTPRPGVVSGNATPRPENGVQSQKDALESGDTAGTSQPASTAEGRTPARESPGIAGEVLTSLKPKPEPLGTFSRGGSRVPSRAASPKQTTTTEQDELEEGEDVDMIDMGDRSGASTALAQGGTTPRIVVDSQKAAEDRMDMT